MTNSDTFHTYQTKLPHHEFDHMEVDISAARYADDKTKISIKVDDGSGSRVTFTRRELEIMILIMKNFDQATLNLNQGAGL